MTSRAKRRRIRRLTNDALARDAKAWMRTGKSALARYSDKPVNRQAARVFKRPPKRNRPKSVLT